MEDSEDDESYDPYVVERTKYVLWKVILGIEGKGDVPEAFSVRVVAHNYRHMKYLQSRGLEQ